MTSDWHDLLEHGEATYFAWYSMDGVEESHAKDLLALAHLAWAHNELAIPMGQCSTKQEVIQDVGAMMCAAFQLGRAAVVAEARALVEPTWWERIKRRIT